MSLKRLLREGRAKKHKTSRKELDELRKVIDRDLKDAALDGLSLDHRFAFAYDAAQKACKMAIACKGYRVGGEAHHKTTIEALGLALGERAMKYVSYLELCRRKRNRLVYDVANIVSASEADEILVKASELRELVESWIDEQYPEYSK